MPYAYILQLTSPILISLFLQSPIGGHPDLPLSSSSSFSKGRCGPRMRSLYHGSKYVKNTASTMYTYRNNLIERRSVEYITLLFK